MIDHNLRMLASITRAYNNNNDCKLCNVMTVMTKDNANSRYIRKETSTNVSNALDIITIWSVFCSLDLTFNFLNLDQTFFSYKKITFCKWCFNSEILAILNFNTKTRKGLQKTKEKWLTVKCENNEKCLKNMWEGQLLNPSNHYICIR